MAVTLSDVGGAVGCRGVRSGLEAAVVGSEPHGAAHVADMLLLLHDVDDVVGGFGVHLGGVGLLKSEYVAGVFDDHTLHTEAYSERGYVVLTKPFER